VTMMDVETKNNILVEKSSTLEIKLHPLVIINISDHWTRAKVQNNVKNPRVVGAIVGIQNGRTVEIFNSYELAYKEEGSLVNIDLEYLMMKSEQFKKVFATYDFLGWYSTGSGVTQDDLTTQKQLSEINESPLYLLLDTVAASRPETKDIPISIMESEIRIISDQPTMFFSKVPYQIESGEAERISVDHIARITPSGDSNTSQISTHLTGIHNSIGMLATRLRILKSFLEAVKSGKIAADPGLLRQLGSLCNQLPALHSDELKNDFIVEFNDSLLITYLASITKGTNGMNEMIDKFNVVYEKQKRKGNPLY